jgi:hypothetical protein
MKSDHSYTCRIRKTTPPRIVSPSQSRSRLRFPFWIAASAVTIVTLLQIRTNVMKAVSEMPSGGSNSGRNQLADVIRRTM